MTKYAKHIHEEFEIGTVEIKLSYEVIYFNEDDYKSVFTSYEKEKTEIEYKKLMESNNFDYVIFNEVQKHSITKEIHIRKK